MATTIVYLGKQFDPISGPILFDVAECEYTPTDIDIKAVSSQAQAYGVKQIVNVPTRINVVDYARAALRTSPIMSTADWSTIGRTCVVSVGNTSAIVVNAEINPISESAILLSDLSYRVISENEIDEISVSSPGGGNISGIELQSAGCVATKIMGLSRDFTYEIKGIKVQYKVIPRCGKRLCWLNSYGALDYHTFEIIESKSSAFKKERIYSSNGWLTTNTETEHITTVTTRNMAERQLKALSYILASSSVWEVSPADNTYTAVDVITKEVVTYNAKSLSKLTVEYRPKIKY